MLFNSGQYCSQFTKQQELDQVSFQTLLACTVFPCPKLGSLAPLPFFSTSGLDGT